MNKLDFSVADDSADSASGLLSIYRGWRRENANSTFASFVALQSDLDDKVLIELATVDLIYQISAGFDVNAESYIRSAAVFESNPDFALDLIDAEICARSDRGETISRSSLARRFPDLNANLDGLLEVHEMDLEVSNSLAQAANHSLEFGNYVTRLRINSRFDIWHGIEQSTESAVLIMRFEKPKGISDQQLKILIQRRKNLQHPHVVSVIEAGVIVFDGVDYIYMVCESLDCRSIKEVLDDPSYPPVGERQVSGWIVDLFNAMSFANRNLKRPIQFDLEQILLCSNPTGPTSPVWIAAPTDWFEQAAPFASDLSEGNMIRMAGLLLFAFCLQETGLEELWYHLNDGLAPIKMDEINSSIPHELCSIYLCCVHSKRKHRYQTLKDAIDDLSRFESWQPVVATKLLRKWF